MESRDFEVIDQFLKLVERPDLLEYYGTTADSADDAIEELIKRRRSWAQGQQSNPKFRNEALWIIKNMALIRRALIDERGSYLDEVARKAQQKNLEKLTAYIEGSLADGERTLAKDVSIREQASKLGLPWELVEARIEAVLAGARSGSASSPVQSDVFVDYYQALRVSADADIAAIEEAHRARYREARDLADKARASEQYALLDEAWRVLRDAERRSDYDRRRREFMLQLERHAAGEDGEFKGFLPPPSKRRVLDAEAAREAESAQDAEPQEFVLPPSARVDHDAPPVQAGPPPARPPRSPARSSSPASNPGAPPAPVVPAPVAPPPPSSSVSGPLHTPQVNAPEVPETLRAKAVPAVGGTFHPSRRQAAPRLELDGPEVHKVQAANDPVTVNFLVRNAGQGQMSGRVLSDREWVVVTPNRLDPLKREQVIEAKILPRQMPRRQAISLVTFVADHGERRSITIDVRRVVPTWLVATVIGTALLLVLAVLMFVLMVTGA